MVARCLKDKVGSGHFILMCTVMDRIGGQKIRYDSKSYESQIRTLAENIRHYNKKKREFINKEHRDLEQTNA